MTMEQFIEERRLWTIMMLGIVLVCFIGSVSRAQSGTVAKVPRASFEVATVKPSDPLDGKESISISAGGNLKATVTVKTLIERAYGVRDFQVARAPEWLESEKYDIVAKSDEMDDPSKMTPEQQDAFVERQGERLKSLLADRFQLKLHTEMKELPVYALVVAKGGAKLKPPKAGEAHRLYSQRPGRLACYGASIGEFVEELPDLGVSRVVVDKTGLTGRYDFNLNWTPDELAESAAGASALEGSIFTALEEQLGLKLESQRGPVQVLVIDAVERPSAN